MGARQGFMRPAKWTIPGCRQAFETGRSYGLPARLASRFQRESRGFQSSHKTAFKAS